MRLVRFTKPVRAGGGPVYVNPDHVAQIGSLPGYSGEPPRTWIRFASDGRDLQRADLKGVDLHVLGTGDQVAAQLMGDPVPPAAATVAA